MKIAFIGIGSMGAAMVPHLVKAGHDVAVWNRNRAAAEALAGVTVLDSPRAAFEREVVLTMLADDAAVRAVVIDSQALSAARAGCVHVLMATISIAFVEELVGLHRAAGVGYVAAPVFGVPAAAAQAQLNVLVAGDAQAVATVRPVLDLLARKVWPLGDEPQRANIAKIAGNLTISLAIEAMAEASALTESYGVAAADFLDIITNTIMASPSYQRYGGFIGSRTYEPGFKLTLGLKDVRLALAAAQTTGTSLPSANVVRERMESAVGRGLGAKDWSVVAEIARDPDGSGAR